VASGFAGAGIGISAVGHIDELATPTNTVSASLTCEFTTLAKMLSFFSVEMSVDSSIINYTNAWTHHRQFITSVI